MRPITLVLPHFQNLGMLAEQQRVWADYPADLRAHLHVIIVDDCSPPGQAPTAASLTFRDLASVRLYRLLEKKRWNWLSCRNLGAEIASTDWLLLTDMDHAVPASTLERLVTEPLDPRYPYRFGRVTAQARWPWDLARLARKHWHKPHNDSWMLTKALFNYDDGERFVCGYDERLSGCYGTSSEFSARLTAVAGGVKLENNWRIVRYPREVIADASTSPDVYTRKNDPENDAELKKRRAERHLIENWRPLRLTVPWEQLV